MLNPLVSEGDSSSSRDIAGLWIAPLFTLDSREGWRPVLAAGEPVAADVGGTPFSVRLRLRAASWSDGSPITTDDVRATWRAIIESKSPTTSRPGYESLADVVVEDARSLRLVFKKPYPHWHELFSAGEGVLPAKALAGKRLEEVYRDSTPLASGPYVLESWTRGLEMRFVRNSRGVAPARLERLTVKLVPSNDTALALFRRGDVDVVIPTLDFGLTARMQQMPEAIVSSDEGPSWVALVVNARQGALAKPEVRRALLGSIDRAGIVEALVRGDGAALESVAPGMPGNAFAGYGADLAGARKALESAARGSRVLRLIGPRPDVGMEMTARKIQRDLMQVGLKVDLQQADPFEVEGWLREGDFDLGLIWMRGSPGPGLGPMFASGAPGNHSGLSDAKLDALLGAADETGADADLRAAGAGVAESAVMLPLFQAHCLAAVRKGLEEVEPRASGVGSLAGAGEWWWRSRRSTPTAHALGRGSSLRQVRVWRDDGGAFARMSGPRAEAAPVGVAE